MRRLTAFAAATLGTTLGSAQPTFYGLTTADLASGAATVATIDLATGLATPLFDIAFTPGLRTGSIEFHDPTGLLVSRFRDDSAPEGDARFTFVTIDPISGDTTTVQFSGLPSNTATLEGLAYDPAVDELLITYGDATLESMTIAVLGLDGSVSNSVSPIAGVTDIDSLAHDDFEGRLEGSDFNGLASPRYFVVNDPLTTPGVTPLFDTVRSNNVGDIAIDPRSGDLFATGFGPFDRNVVKVKPEAYDPIGDNGLDRNIVGIAFGPDAAGKADLVAPFGIVSQADVAAFITLFFNNDPRAAALAPPLDIVSQADVAEFVSLFFAG
ncbi:MAG: hypothetical protein AAFR38_04115 [Planctomycetota bacterium]